MLFGVLYLLIVPLRETLSIAMLTAVIAGAMEIFGNLSGLWNYDTFPIPTGFSLNYLQLEFPLFLIFYWIFRLAVVRLLANFVMRYIVKKKSLQYDKFF